MSTADADLTVGQKDATALMLSAVDETVGDELKQIGGVEQVNGVIIGFLTMPESPYFIALGQDPRGFAIQHYRIIEGQPLSSRKQILIGKTTAKNFKKTIGENFRINEVNYRVVGIYETGVSFEDGGAVLSLADAQRAFGQRHQVSYFAIKVKNKTRIDEIKNEIETRWQDLSASRSGDATTQSEVLSMYRSFGWFLGIFAVLVGGLGMMNTTLMSVFERTQEIGVLRALGWRRGRILRMVLVESLALSLLSALVGSAIGVGLAWSFTLAPTFGQFLMPVFTLGLFAEVLIIATALGGVYPAWRAMRLRPIEALRYE
jgi:ABC-type antimicrobial peptide transport system permease subunit